MIVFGPNPEAPPGPPFESVRALFPESVCGAFAHPSDVPGPLLPEEAACVQRAVPSRRREFAVGRWCAHRALEQLGIAGQALPIGRDRAPVWPAGVVGSISHCSGFAGAVVARAAHVEGLGFDAEPALPLDDDLAAMICTATELAWADDAFQSPSANWPRVLFSAKESVHKCISPLSGVMLDYQDVTLALCPSRGTFSVRPVKIATERWSSFHRVSGRFLVTDSLIMTSAFIESAEVSS